MADIESCYDIAGSVDERLRRVLTQYRESPKLLHVIRTYLTQVAEVASAICKMPFYFDLDTAVGDQLTILGKELGWPRCHCVCATQPVFGFECEGFPSDYVIGELCDDAVTWVDCGPFGVAEICLNDDEIYRQFLKVRRYQMLALYDLESLTEAIRLFWGENAIVLDAGHRRVVISPGRDLSKTELALLQLYPRVLPIAPGVRTRFHFGTHKVFGFGDGWGGWCEEWEPVGQALVTETGEEITDENGDPIMTGPLTRDAEWMCEIDVRPYDCAA